MVKPIAALKKAATVLCDKPQPTVSLIAPLKRVVQESLEKCDGNSKIITQMKTAIVNDLASWPRGAGGVSAREQ